MRTLSRKTAAIAAIATLTALAAPASTALATHENHGGNAVICYLKTGDSFRCWHMGP